MSPAASRDAAPRGEVLPEGRFSVIGLQGWYFGIPLERSRGVMEQIRLTRVPMGPEAVLGLTHIQGRVVTVLDLAHLLGLTGSGSAQNFFLVSDEDEQVGLLVDSVEDIVLVAPLALEAIEVELPPGVHANASGFFRWRGHQVVNLSVERLLK